MSFYTALPPNLMTRYQQDLRRRRRRDQQLRGRFHSYSVVQYEVDGHHSPVPSGWTVVGPLPGKLNLSPPGEPPLLSPETEDASEPSEYHSSSAPPPSPARTESGSTPTNTAPTLDDHDERDPSELSPQPPITLFSFNVMPPSSSSSSHDAPIINNSEWFASPLLLMNDDKELDHDEDEQVLDEDVAVDLGVDDVYHRPFSSWRRHRSLDELDFLVMELDDTIDHQQQDPNPLTASHSTIQEKSVSTMTSAKSIFVSKTTVTSKKPSRATRLFTLMMTLLLLVFLTTVGLVEHQGSLLEQAKKLQASWEPVAGPLREKFASTNWTSLIIKAPIDWKVVTTHHEEGNKAFSKLTTHTKAPKECRPRWRGMLPLPEERGGNVSIPWCVASKTPVQTTPGPISWPKETTNFMLKWHDQTKPSQGEGTSNVRAELLPSMELVTAQHSGSSQKGRHLASWHSALFSQFAIADEYF